MEPLCSSHFHPCQCLPGQRGEGGALDPTVQPIRWNSVNMQLRKLPVLFAGSSSESVVVGV